MPESSSIDSGGQMDQTRWRKKRAKFDSQVAALETRAHHGVLDLRLRILTRVSDIMLDSELSEETSGRLDLVVRHDAGSLLGVLPGFVVESPGRSPQRSLRNKLSATEDGAADRVRSQGLSRPAVASGDEYPPGRSEMPKKPEAPGRLLDEGTWNQFVRSDTATPSDDSSEPQKQCLGTLRRAGS